MKKCIVCDSPEVVREFVFKEMMFGSGDEFTYLECATCGCLQLRAIPEDISKYYPDNYYSFKKQSPFFLKTFFVTLRDKHYIGIENLIGNLLIKRFPAPLYLKVYKILKAGVNWKILDVGSGTGEKLLALKRIGFKNILGIDPHLERDIYYKNGLTILKKSLFEIEGKFDLLLFNHSLEHMEDPVSILKEAKQKMKDESILVLRVPLAGCFAWQKYGTFWDGLDAPRHIFIPTKKSINILAERNKFEIINEYCDSTSMQFWASEQYQKGISLTDPRSYSINPKKSIFTKRMINNFSREAEKLNEEGKGDIACFALKKIKTS